MESSKNVKLTIFQCNLMNYIGFFPKSSYGQKLVLRWLQKNSSFHESAQTCKCDSNHMESSKNVKLTIFQCNLMNYIGFFPKSSYGQKLVLRWLQKNSSFHESAQTCKCDSNHMESSKNVKLTIFQCNLMNYIGFFPKSSYGQKLVLRWLQKNSSFHESAQTCKCDSNHMESSKNVKLTIFQCNLMNYIGFFPKSSYGQKLVLRWLQKNSSFHESAQTCKCDSNHMESSKNVKLTIFQCNLMNYIGFFPKSSYGQKLVFWWLQ